MTETANRSVGQPATSSIRRGAFAAFRALGVLTLVACVLQIVLAGHGAFGAGYDDHRFLGMIIEALTVVILVLGLIARPSKSAVGVTVLLVVLATFGQYGLASLGSDQDAWFGGLHALNGLLIMGILSRLAFTTRLGGLEQSRASYGSAGPKITPTVIEGDERSPEPHRRSRPSR
ncbi:DUF6220 domain-containing protein [Nocardioidaceae bacterium SCSIO 66511]|nr:DUF6220 domain-containing protein [Nocardioidaceae bacterium SCSIO 66511]